MFQPIKIDNDETVSIASVSFSNGQHGWIAGGRLVPIRKDDPAIASEVEGNQIVTGCLYRTTDGGNTWTPQQLPRLVGAFDNVTFWNHNIGIVSNRRNIIFTNDGGQNWSDLRKKINTVGQAEGPMPFLSAHFFSEAEGVLLFSDFEFRAAVTQDKGTSWKFQTWKVPPVSDDTSSWPPPPRVAFRDSLHGVLIYSRFYGGDIFKTDDSGNNWTRINMDAIKEEKFFDVFLNKNSRGLLLTNQAIYEFVP